MKIHNIGQSAAKLNYYINNKKDISNEQIFIKIKRLLLMPKGSNQPNRLTIEQIAKNIALFDDYELDLNNIKEYKNNYQKLPIRHKSKNHIFNMSYTTFQRGCRCSICVHNKRLTDSDVSKFIIDNYNSKFEKISDYIRSNDKMTFKCNRCNKIFERTFNQIKNAKLGCPNCDTKYNRQLTYSDIKYKISKYKDGSFEFVIPNNIKLNDKFDYASKFQIKHTICDSIFEIDLDAIYRGKQCPICLAKSNDSEGVRSIKNFLIEHNISFESEKTFDNCIYISKLLFDFYLPSYNLILEFDGMQHFYKKFMMHNEDLNIVKKRDQIKNQYCKDNNINLLRISSNQKYSIKTILQNILIDNKNNLESSTTIQKYNLYYNSINNDNYYIAINKDYFNEVDSSESK